MIYDNKCTWFLFDKKSNECKLFQGNPTDFQDDCSEFGYSVEPDYDQCSGVAMAGSENECDVRKYNIIVSLNIVRMN